MRRTAACIVLAAVLLVPTAASAAQGLRTDPISWWNVFTRALAKVVTTVTHAVAASGAEGTEGSPSGNSSITIDPFG
jgi:hypothetical protein